MPESNRGFDPLSSLFEAPDPFHVSPPGADQNGAAEKQSEPEGAKALDPDLEPTEPISVDPALAPTQPGSKTLGELAAQQSARTVRQAPPAPRVPKHSSLADRAVRPKGDALAAARAAVAAEQEQAKESAAHHKERHAARVRDQVENLVPSLLPGVPDVRVVNAIIPDERKLLTALWSAHRSKFIQDGQLEFAVAATVVLQAVSTVPHGSLVAAHLETAASDYLVWIDVDRSVVLAAFPDARSYFGGR